jgi:hypothetical protein
MVKANLLEETFFIPWRELQRDEDLPFLVSPRLLDEEDELAASGTLKGCVRQQLAQCRHINSIPQIDHRWA